MIYDITESDIPDLPDDVLERVVAEWLSDVEVLYPDKEEWLPKPAGEMRPDDPPAYTSDDAAAWRLFRRLPLNAGVRDALRIQIQHRTGDSSILRMQPIDIARTAAMCAVCGDDPREVE